MPRRVAGGARGMEEAGPVHIIRTVIHNGDGATTPRRAHTDQTHSGSRDMFTQPGPNQPIAQAS